MSTNPPARVRDLTLGDCGRAAVLLLRGVLRATWPVGLVLAVGAAVVHPLPGGLEGGLTSLRLRALSQGVQLAALRSGALPGSMDGLQAAMGVETWPTDAWGRPIHVISTPNALALVSLGADGAVGGTGADADLSEVVARPGGAAPPTPAAPAPPPG